MDSVSKWLKFKELRLKLIQGRGGGGGGGGRLVRPPPKLKFKKQIF
jgi:hypothetical protein